MCPFTRKVVPELSPDYIASLADKYSRYAEPLNWELFVERYPSALIQSDTYSLDFHSGTYGRQRGDDAVLKDFVDKDRRVDAPTLASAMTYERICQGDIPSEYEYVFHMIKTLVKDEDDQELLKLIAIGYSPDDIADTLGMDKNEIRRRQRAIRECSKDLEGVLCE